MAWYGNIVDDEAVEAKPEIARVSSGVVVSSVVWENSIKGKRTG
jgi:hypothetical protein